MRYLLLVGLFFVSAVSAYEYKEPLESPINKTDYYAEHGAPAIRVYKEDKDCKGACAYTVNLGNGRAYTTRRGEAEIFAQAQYGNTAYAYVRVKYDCGKRRDCRDYIMYSTHNAVTFPGPSCRRAMTRHVSASGELMCLHDDRLETFNSRGRIRNIDLPVEARYGSGAIGNNLTGQTAVAFIGRDDNKLYMSNSQADWVSADTNLHGRSDFNNILDPYPVDDVETVVGVYEYANIRNRGVALYRFRNSYLSSSGYLVNTSAFNYGSSGLEVFGQGRDIFVTGRNQSERKDQTYQLATYDLRSLGMDDDGEPVRFASARQSMLDMMFGYGVTQTSWDVNQKIRSGGDTQARASYDMNDSLLHNYYMQGRYRDTQVTVNYLTSEGEESDNNLVSKGTELLTAVVDFNGMFDGAMTLRLELEHMESGGVVNYSDGGGHSFRETFETDYSVYGLSFVMEEGGYLGFKYSTYDAPSAVGFEKRNGRYQGSAFDKDFSIDRYMLVIGYDEASYGGRYEMSYNRFYIDGEFGLGINKLNVSRDALEEATGTREGKIYGKYALAVTSAVELGYTYQRRSTRLRGLGVSFQAGYRAKVDWTYQKPSDEASSDEFYLLYERTDLWHGPFVQFNAIF